MSSLLLTLLREDPAFAALAELFDGTPYADYAEADAAIEMEEEIGSVPMLAAACDAVHKKLARNKPVAEHDAMVWDLRMRLLESMRLLSIRTRMGPENADLKRAPPVRRGGIMVRLKRQR